MRTITDLIELFNDEFGLDLSAEAAGAPLQTLPGWDSLHLLRAVVVLEAATGRRVRVSELITAGTLAEIHALAVAA